MDPQNTSQKEGQVLEISDHGELYIACKPVSVHWRDLGARLEVLQNTLATIEADCNGKVENCMSAMLEKWLRRPLGEVRERVKPTWKSLCVALSHIDGALAERLAEEHDCRVNRMSDSEATQLSDDNTVSLFDVDSPAFLPQMCGCGKCTVIGWRTGDSCEKPRFSKFPKLLVVDPKYLSLKQDFARHASLCKATRGLIDQFNLIVNEIWDQLYHSFETQQVSLSKIIRTLRSGLGVQVPMFSDLDSLQNHCHSLRISWYNFKPLDLWVTRVLANLSPTLLADWNSYLAEFREYCSARNLKDLKDVHFRVEEENIFLLEVDDCYDEFTLSDIDQLCSSLGIALNCPSVYLSLVTVGKGSLIIYLYYSYSDYLSVFQSLTTDQLSMISQIKIKKCRILSLNDLRSQFRYNIIQSYFESPLKAIDSSPSSSSDEARVDDPHFESSYSKKGKDEFDQASLSEKTEILKKLSQMKDIELFRTQEERSIALLELKKKEDEIEELRNLVGSLKIQKSEQHLKIVELSKREAEMFHSMQEKEDTIGDLRKRVESHSSHLQRITQLYQKVAPLEFVKDLPLCSQRQLPKIQVQLKLSTYLPKITSNQLIKHLEDANFQFSKHWEDLTRRLNIDIDDRNKQRVQIGITSDYKRALEELLSIWISSDENATWEILIDTVHIYEPKCAENMRKQLGLFPADVSTKLQQQCDLHLLTCVNLNLQPQSFHQLAPYFLSHSELEKIEEYDESQRMLKILQHWKDCRGLQATYEALICIFRNALESSEELTDLIVTHVVNPSQARQMHEATYNPPPYTLLSDDQVLDLRKEYRSIKNKFATFYSLVARSLITANANSNSFFNELKMFLMARSTTPVNYQSVGDVNSLLQAVIGESSWFNFRIFEEIIEQFGQAADKEKLEVYRRELSAYLNKSILKLPNRVPGSSELEHSTTVYLKIPDNEDKLPDLYGLDVMHIKQKLGEHIGVHESKIQFVEYRLGCIEVVFSVPNSGISCMSNVVWDAERKEYRVCVDLLSILPMDFCDRNQELTESLQK